MNHSTLGELIFSTRPVPAAVVPKYAVAPTSASAPVSPQASQASSWLPLALVAAGIGVGIVLFASRSRS